MPGPGLVDGPRRAVSLVGGVSLLAVLLPAWRTTASTPSGAVLVLLGFSAAVLLVVLACTVRRPRGLDRVDVAAVATAAVLFLGLRRSFLAPGHLAQVANDESYLGHFALATRLAGGDPYRADYPQLAHLPGGTVLFDGGVVTRYSYPPLTLELGAVLHVLAAPLGEPWVVAALAVVAALLIASFALPRPYRALAVPVVVGFGLLDSFTARGFPVIVALPFLLVVAWRWADIGRQGTLGRRGTVQAVALGLAIGAHQLAWFVAPFVVVAVAALRWRELPPRRALAVTGRFAAIAVGVFLLLDLPFLVRDPAAWLSGMLAVLTQHALPYGAGAVLLPITVLRQAGDFSLFGVATALALLGLLVLTAARIRRVAPAVAVFPAAVFLLSARSNAAYLVALAPVWMVWASAVPPAPAAGWPPPAAQRRPIALAGRLLAPGLLAAALVVTAVAVLLPGPLALRAHAPQSTGSGPAVITVDVTNRSAAPVRPRYSVGRPGALGAPLRIVTGPRTIPAGGSARLVLAPAQSRTPPGGTVVWAVSTTPDAFSSGPLPAAG